MQKTNFFFAWFLFFVKNERNELFLIKHIV